MSSSSETKNNTGSNTNKQGVYINGRNQVIELLRQMGPEEKNRLLNLISMKNPQTANELREESITFETLDRLDDHSLLTLIDYIEPDLMGLALKASKKTFTRRILGLSSRPYAERCFEIISTELKNQFDTSKRAQKRVLETAIKLIKKNVVSF